MLRQQLVDEFYGHRSDMGKLFQFPFTVPFQRFEAEVIVVEVTVRDDGRVKTLLVLLDNGVHIVRNQAGLLPGLRVHVVV